MKDGLTKKQIAVLKGIGDGLNSKEIGGRMALSNKTVEGHIGQINTIFQSHHNRVKLARIAIAFGISSLCLLVMGFASPPAEAAPAWKTGTIVVHANPTTGGNVSGGGSYKFNSVITLGAHAFTNWTFVQWQDGVTTSNRTIVVPRGTTVFTATFRTNPPVQYGTVILAAEPINGGTLAGSGTYTALQSVTITATAAANFTFQRWQDGTTDNPRTIIVPVGNVMYTATFATNAPIYGSINTVATPSQGGSVDGSGTYPANMPVTLTAHPSVSWRFSQWQDGLSNISRVVTTPSNATTTYTAFFQNFGTLMLTAEPPQAGTVSGAGTYLVGTLVTLSALPSSTNWLFARWQDGNTNMQRQVTVISGTIQMTATFTTNQIPTPHSANLFWDKSTLPGIKYKVSYGAAPRTYTNSVTVGTNFFTLTNVNDAETYYFTTQALTTNNLLSAYSCEVWWKYPGSNSCN